MRSIYKYEVMPGDFYLVLPVGSVVLSCGVQNDKPYLWILVDTTVKEREKHNFTTYATGEPIGEERKRTFIGTVQCYGMFVFHIFEHVV